MEGFVCKTHTLAIVQMDTLETTARVSITYYSLLCKYFTTSKLLKKSEITFTSYMKENGFISGRSTVLQVITILDTRTYAIDMGHLTDVI